MRSCSARRKVLPSAESAQTEARLIAENVTGVVIPGCGHFLAEEAPDALIEVLDPFLAPYKVGWASFAD